jgi:4,5:9,10-diseco-3-hydroxy-5,9,17-trioxoandrosta-1(10),2-diene-4-oate hydrolase
VSLSVKRFGRGMPVVCLAAVGHDALDFAPLAKRVGDRCELICIEWPSHGDSGADHQPAGAARYCELIDGALRVLAIDRPVILGNSIGGAVAILYAARHPVRGLVLCDSGGLVEVTRAIAIFCKGFERFFAAGERGAWWYPSAFAAYYRIVLPQRAAAEQRRRIVARARDLANILREAWASFGTPAADIRRAAASLDVPIWVAWAERDRVIPLRACLPAIERLRNAKLDTFDAGHTAFLEQPDAFARGFRDFLAHLPPVSDPLRASA